MLRPTLEAAGEMLAAAFFQYHTEPDHTELDRTTPAWVALFVAVYNVNTR